MSRPRTIVAPNGHGWHDAYQDDPCGLIWLGSYRTTAEALAEYPAARVVPAVWDAPMIDPADPATHPGEALRDPWPRDVEIDGAAPDDWPW